VASSVLFGGPGLVGGDGVFVGVGVVGVTHRGAGLPRGWFGL
jgi:hypothetical protein